MAFEYDKIIADIEDWRQWMAREEGDAQKSYKAWWNEEYGWYSNLTTGQRCVSMLTSTRYVFLGIGLLYQRYTSWVEIGVTAACALSFIIICILITTEWGHDQCIERSMKTLWISVAIFVPLGLLIVFPPRDGFVWHAVQTLLGLGFIVGYVFQLLLIFDIKWPVVAYVCKAYDYALGFILLCPNFLLSILYVPGVIQTRLLFNNAFSRGVIIDDLLRGGDKRKTNDSKAAAPAEVAMLQALVQEQRDLLAKQNQLLETLTSGGRPVGAAAVPTIISADALRNQSSAVAFQQAQARPKKDVPRGVPPTIASSPAASPETDDPLEYPSDDAYQVGGSASIDFQRGKDGKRSGWAPNLPTLAGSPAIPSSALQAMKTAFKAGAPSEEKSDDA